MTTVSASNRSLPGHPARYRTAAEWLHDLGDVPPDRILFDPLPGTATEADVLRLDDHEDRLCELIDGTLVEKPEGFDESVIAGRIIFFLNMFVLPRKLGVVTAPDGMLRILPDRIRIADVSFISIQQLPAGKLPEQRVPALVADLAVEVLSASNTAREIEIKLSEYFRSGTRLAWIVDPKTKTVAVYITSATDCVRKTEAESIDGGTV